MNAGLRRIDQGPIPPAEPGVRAFICVRNEAHRLPFLLQYHRRLGVSRFFIVDNDSSDGTSDYLLTEPDVHLWQSKDGYKDNGFGTAWLKELLNAFAPDQWALILDADEFLVYPGCEQADLKVVCDFLDRRNFRVLPTLLLDMYSDRPVIETAHESGQDIRAVCAYFDSGEYLVNPATGYIHGGVRHRLFKPVDPISESPIVLSKFALRRWLPGNDLDRGPHRTFLPGAGSRALTGALLHFKFIDTFVRRAQEESIRKEHWNEASEYAGYVRRFAAEPGLCLMGPRSVRYEDSEQLVRLGLMLASTDYRESMNILGRGEVVPRVTRFSAGGICE